MAAPKGVSPYALTRDRIEVRLGEYARDSTAAEETIAVWGYCPQVYFHGNRLPGVRDYMCHYVTGYSVASFSPLFERAPRAFGHTRAQEMFLEDLLSRRPKYIFDLSDIANTQLPFVQYPLTLYPRIAEYVRTHYTPEARLGEAYIYRIKPDSFVP
jgi:hypothetical protein